VYLRLPEGVTYTSDTGQFLATATPIALVPEPATYALLIGGLGLIGLARRRAM
jgi:hypothetical protein